MSKIIGVKHEKAAQSAIDLGIAMQLTNIARDVYEDSKMKRIYLPANWIPNISLENLNNLDEFNSENDEKISKAIHKVISLSEKFYINGFAGLKYIPFSTRLGIFIAANVYRGIGIKIKSNKKKYFREYKLINSENQQKWYENIEPGAVGSLCVTIALVSALGYGAWSFFQEIQKVDITPTENQPVVLTELQNLPTALNITNNLMLDNTEDFQEGSSRINRIYRSTALDQPVIVARDEPISKLDPNQFGLFAPIPSSKEIGIEEIISDLIPKKNSTDKNLQTNFPKVSADTPPVVTLITSKEAWIEIVAADGSVIYKNLMQPGVEFSLPQTESAPKLLAGMSGYVYMAIDGVLYGPAGKGVNVVKNVTLDPKSIMLSYEPAQIKSDPDLQKLVAELGLNILTVEPRDQ